MADRIWTADDVADHFEEAFRTLRKLPPVKAQGYFSTWPAVVHTAREIAFMEPEPMRVWPSSAAISRLEQTFDWMPWLDKLKAGDKIKFKAINDAGKFTVTEMQMAQ